MPGQKKNKGAAAAAEAHPPARPPPVAGSKHDIFGDGAARARKRTEEGFAIYSEEELGLAGGGGKGRKDAGDTELCPFDCDCCF